MLKSMSTHQKDSKEIVKSNFVTSCFAFRGSIKTTIGRIPLNINSYVSMLDFLYIDGYALSFETEIMINLDLWIWNLILDRLMCNT